jgi:HlyD family secretion protein
MSRPLIRSFEFVVEPHVPFRSTLPDQGAMPTTAPPPLTIISILPEGSKVKARDVVCELDSSLLRDALAVQQLRYVQAKAWVEQAKFSLEADTIALREFEYGVLPQDIALVRQNVGICQIQKEQAARNLAWARRAFAKGFRTEAQVNADAAVLEQSEIAVRDAEGMLEQLIKYTGRRIIKSCQARIQAIRAELLSLENSFRLERERLRRIETMIANCKMRAPRDGTIVYADQPNGSGAIDTQIREGLIVHSSQPIFRLLDPHHIQVRAKINESQVARIRPGQPVLIHLEAFPDHEPLLGSVTEVVPIPSLANGLFSDVRTFFAKVRIDSGAFDAMTTGLTAELEFLVESKRHVTRVPLEAVRWIDDHPFAATVSGPATDLDWQWRPIALGATDTDFAEVVSGLKPGDRVVAHSESLPAADLEVPDPETKFDLALGGRPPGR